MAKSLVVAMSGRTKADTPRADTASRHKEPL